jgi:hypothetical protein
MKLISRELLGRELIMAVAYTEGEDIFWDSDEEVFMYHDREEDGDRRYDPTELFEQAGPICVREKMWIKYPFFEEGEVEAINGHFGFPNVINAFGPDQLIASMRCLLATKHGDVIDIPDHVIAKYYK